MNLKSPATRSNSRDGFTMLELIAAIAVVAVAATLSIGMLLASRHATTSIQERRLAGDVAQGALERLRAWPASKLNPVGVAVLALPPEAGHLAEASIAVEVMKWQKSERLRHVKVAIRWRSSRGVRREEIREGLIRARK